MSSPSTSHCFRPIEVLTKMALRLLPDIVENLTVEVIAHEAFSNFSAAFEEVRKVQVDFFLKVCFPSLLVLRPC